MLMIKYNHSVTEQRGGFLRNMFFKSTTLYKEYYILNFIENESNVRQRYIGEYLGLSVSTVNSYIEKLESQGLINRKYVSKKVVKYEVTRQGKKRRSLLNIAFLDSTTKIYKDAKKNIREFLSEIYQKKMKKIILYGAGEVTDILLETITSELDIQIEIVCVIDDDYYKQGTKLKGIMILSYTNAIKTEHDAILISSYTNSELIKQKLVSRGYNVDKIINYF